MEGEVYPRGEGEQRHLGEPRVNRTLSQAMAWEGRGEKRARRPADQEAKKAKRVA